MPIQYRSLLMVSGATEMPCKVRQGLWDTGSLGEDVLSLVFHQHLHALHISAPQLQAVLHPLDLKTNQITWVSG